MLGDQAVTEIVTAASATEALARLRAFTPDVAILDVNLGAETSVPVAAELTRRDIPFVFATGYGDRSIIPQEFVAVPVVRKPYDAAAIVSQLTQLLGRATR